MRCNPVYRKELKVAVRTPRFAMRIVVYNVILAVITLLLYYASFGGYYGYYNNNYQSVLVIYVIVAVIEMGFIAFLVPSLTAGSIAGERERQTLDILLSTTLQARQIIVGKLFSSISMILLLFISSFPIITVVFSIGGIRIQALLELILLAVITSIYIGSIGMYFSVRLKKSVTATAITYGVTVAILLGSFLVVYGVYFINYAFSGDESVGITGLILLINPLMTGIAMMFKQFGSVNFITQYMNQMGYCPSIIAEYWFEWSLLLQLLLSLFILKRATKALETRE